MNVKEYLREGDHCECKKWDFSEQTRVPSIHHLMCEKLNKDLEMKYFGGWIMHMVEQQAKIPKEQGPETRRNHAYRQTSGFYNKYMQGKGLDIGCGRGWKSVLPTATGIDIGFPGYDGKTLPFDDGSQDYVYSSHCLEHIDEPMFAVREWFRVLKTNGFLVIAVPHALLYEKKFSLPSLWNTDHKRFYLPKDLLTEIRAALKDNTYRIRHFEENDRDYDYSIGPDQHCAGSCEIECVIQKIKPPTWEVK